MPHRSCAVCNVFNCNKFLKKQPKLLKWKKSVILGLGKTLDFKLSDTIHKQRWDKNETGTKLRLIDIMMQLASLINHKI